MTGGVDGWPNASSAGSCVLARGTTDRDRDGRLGWWRGSVPGAEPVVAGRDLRAMAGLVPGMELVMAGRDLRAVAGLGAGVELVMPGGDLRAVTGWNWSWPEPPVVGVRTASVLGNAGPGVNWPRPGRLAGVARDRCRGRSRSWPGVIFARWRGWVPGGTGQGPGWLGWRWLRGCGSVVGVA
jgi:hypothetical protein